MLRAIALLEPDSTSPPKRAKLSTASSSSSLFRDAVYSNSSLCSSLSPTQLEELILLGPELAKQFESDFFFPGALDPSLCDAFIESSSTALPKLGVQALAMRSKSSPPPPPPRTWASIASALNVPDADTLLLALLQVWEAGFRPASIVGASKEFERSVRSDKLLVRLAQAERRLHSQLVLNNPSQQAAATPPPPPPLRHNGSTSSSSHPHLPPPPRGVSGEHALQLALQCAHFPLPDSMVYYSHAEGFFKALARAPAHTRLGALTETVHGLSSLAAAPDSAKLKSFLIDLVRQAPELLETLSAIPHCPLDSVFKEYLQSTGDFLMDRATMGRILGLIGCEQILAILLSLPPDVASKPRARYMLQELDAAARQDFIALCLHQFMRELTPSSGQHRRGRDREEEEEEEAEEEEAAAGNIDDAHLIPIEPTWWLVRLEQLVANFGPEAYSTDFLSKIKPASSREFQRLVVRCFQRSARVLGAAVWALKLQIQLVNASPHRKMRCRSVFVSRARARLAREDTAGQRNPDQALVESFAQEYDILNEIPPPLLVLRDTRPDYVQRTLVPLLVQQQEEPSATALLAAMKQRWPEMFADKDEGQLVPPPEELLGCDEVVNRICSALASNNTNSLLALPQDAFDKLCKDLVTFSVISAGPSHRVNLSLVRALLASSPRVSAAIAASVTTPTAPAATSGVVDRQQQLASVVLANLTEHLPLLLRCLAMEILIPYCGGTGNKNHNNNQDVHLLGVFPPSALTRTAEVLVREAVASGRSIECAVGALHVFARLLQHYPNCLGGSVMATAATARGVGELGALAWLRLRLAAHEQAPWCSHAFDLFDAYFALDYSIFPAVDKYIELECAYKVATASAVDHSSNVLRIVQTVKERFDAWQVVRLVVMRGESTPVDVLFAARLLLHDDAAADDAHVSDVLQEYMAWLCTTATGGGGDDGELLTSRLEVGLLVFPPRCFPTTAPVGLRLPSTTTTTPRLRALLLRMFVTC